MGATHVPNGERRAPVVGKLSRRQRSKHPFVGTIDLPGGLLVDVENRAGSVRSGEDPDGHKWAVKMSHHYGEIRGTEAVDGDPLDVYVGPDVDSPLAVVVQQNRPDTGQFDEHKVMLGFRSVADAVRAYRGQYDKPGFYGGHKAIPITRFWRWCRHGRGAGKLIKKSMSAPWEPIGIHGGMRRGESYQWPSVDHARMAAEHHIAAYKRLSRPMSVVDHAGQDGQVAYSGGASAITFSGAAAELAIARAARAWYVEHRNDVRKGEKPPGGFSPIPGSKHGGYRKQVGSGYTYWYPGDSAPKGAVNNHKEQAEAIVNQVAAKIEGDPSWKGSKEHAAAFAQYRDHVDAANHADGKRPEAKPEVRAQDTAGAPGLTQGQANRERDAAHTAKLEAQFGKPGEAEEANKTEAKPKAKPKAKPDEGTRAAQQQTARFHAKSAEKSRKRLEGLLRSRNPSQRDIEAALSEYEHHIDGAGGHASSVRGHKQRLRGAPEGSRVDAGDLGSWRRSGGSYTAAGKVWRGVTLPIGLLARLLAAMTGARVIQKAGWCAVDDETGRRLWLTQLGELEKGGAHKYVRRIPTGDPKRPWRYVYHAASGRGGIASEYHMRVGAAYEFESGGKRGHYRIESASGDKITVKHDESGHTATMTREAFGKMLREHHAKAIQAHVDKLRTKRRGAKHALTRSNIAAKIRSLGHDVGDAVADPKAAEKIAEMKGWLARAKAASVRARAAGRAQVATMMDRKIAEQEKALSAAELAQRQGAAAASAAKRKKAKPDPSTMTKEQIRAELSALDTEKNPIGYGLKPANYKPMSVGDPARFAAIVARERALKEALGIQPWQRTSDEVRGALGMPAAAHKRAIQAALDAGKAVPAHVLADYPELTKPTATDKRAHKAEDKKLADALHGWASKYGDAATDQHTQFGRHPGKQAREFATRLQSGKATDGERRRLHKEAAEILAKPATPENPDDRKAAPTRAAQLADKIGADNLATLRALASGGKVTADNAKAARELDERHGLLQHLGHGEYKATAAGLALVGSADAPAPKVKAAPSHADVSAALAEDNSRTGAQKSKAGSSFASRVSFAQNNYYALKRPDVGTRVRDAVGGSTGVVTRLFKRSARVKMDEGSWNVGQERKIDFGVMGMPRDEALAHATSKASDADIIAVAAFGSGILSKDPSSASYQAAAEAERVKRGLPTWREVAQATPDAEKKPAPKAPDVPPTERVADKLAALGVRAHGGDVNRALAVRAHEGTSHVPERRADGVAADYVGHMNSVGARFAKYATDDASKEKLAAALKTYKHGYLSKLNAWLGARSRTMSTMVTGPARFPVRSNNKKMDTERRRMDELTDWSDKALKRIDRDMKGPRAAAADPHAVLAQLRADHEDVKSSHLSSAGDVTRSRQRIKYQEDKIARDAAREAAPENKTPFDGGHIHDDPETDRLKIVFDSKPSAAKIAELKGAGFRWAPSVGAWQRKRTHNARYAAQRIVDSTAKGQMPLGDLMKGKSYPIGTVRMWGGKHWKKVGPRKWNEIRDPKAPAAAAKAEAGAISRAEMEAAVAPLGGGVWDPDLKVVIPNDPQQVAAHWNALKERTAQRIGDVPKGNPAGRKTWTNDHKRTAEGLHELATDTAGAWMQSLRGVATVVPGSAANFGPGDRFAVKSTESLNRKVSLLAGAEGVSADQIINGAIADSVRGTIVVNSPEDIGQVIRAAVDKFGAENVCIDNKWGKAGYSSGYVGLHASVRFPDAQGTTIKGELQIHARAMNNGTADTPKEQAHTIYEVTRAKGAASHPSIQRHGTRKIEAASQLLFAAAMARMS